MESIKSISVNLAEPTVLPTVYAKQYDKDARYIYISLYSGSEEFAPPDGTVGMLRISKPDGTFCFYDSSENEGAVVINGNIVECLLVEQALTVPGNAAAEVNLYNADGEKITSFAFVVAIEASVVDDPRIASTDYFNILTDEIAKAVAAAEASKTAPYIQGGTWWTYNQEAMGYEDTGYDAQGEKGDTGATGAAGADGADGLAATIEIGTVTTGAPGTSASIVNSGDENEAIFDFTIPRGDKGDSGGGIEMGSNSNGQYYKFSDGLLICTKKIALTSVACTTASGGLYRSNIINAGPLAESFVGTPNVQVTLGAGDTYAMLAMQDTSDVNALTLYVMRGSSGTVSNLSVFVVAIGTWK